MPISASELRANIYRLLDEVLASDRPLEIERKGRTLVIAPRQRSSRLTGLTRRDDFIAGDPESLVSIDWSRDWRP